MAPQEPVLSDSLRHKGSQAPAAANKCVAGVPTFPPMQLTAETSLSSLEPNRDSAILPMPEGTLLIMERKPRLEPLLTTKAAVPTSGPGNNTYQGLPFSCPFRASTGGNPLQGKAKRNAGNPLRKSGMPEAVEDQQSPTNPCKIGLPKVRDQEVESPNPLARRDSGTAEQVPSPTSPTHTCAIKSSPANERLPVISFAGAFLVEASRSSRPGTVT